MGHAINWVFLEAKSKEAAMREGYADACEFAEYNVDRCENPSGSYDNSFRFYDRTFETEEDAADFFRSLGSYADGVCMVKQPSKSAQSKYQKTVSRVTTKQQEMKEKAIEKFKERTSATVGCKKCGTRIPGETALQRRLYCPNCGNWLVPDSYKQRYEKLAESLKQAEEQLRKDTMDNGKPRYWAKYEVHC